MSETSVHLLSGSNTSKAWRYDMLHSSPKDRFIWVTRGQAKAILNGTLIGLVLNTLVYIPAGHPFKMTLAQGTFCMVVETEYLTASAATGARLRVGEVGAQKDVVNLIDNIRRETETPEVGFQRATKAHVLLLEVWMLRALNKQPPPPKPKAAQRQTLEFLKLLERDYGSPKTPQHYAQILDVTPTHLTRTTNQSVGFSASQLVSERKMYAAKVMLADTRLKIVEISKRLGFSSAGYFTRSFHTHCTISPTAFRKTAINTTTLHR